MESPEPELAIFFNQVTSSSGTEVSTQLQNISSTLCPAC